MTTVNKNTNTRQHSTPVNAPNRGRNDNRNNRDGTKPKKPMHPLLHRYITSMRYLRTQEGRVSITKAQQVDVAYAMNQIDRYGFSFFPNVYVRDAVMLIGGIVDAIRASKEPAAQ